MKICLSFLSFLIVFAACNNAAMEQPAVKVAEADTLKQKFFPVTSFIKGEIYEIRNGGVNPLKYTTVNNNTDSVWLKMEEIELALSEFLIPEIDTVNLTTLFTEKSFLDQSINAVTLTYEPKTSLPDSMKLRRWDIYIDPETQKVKRLYMVKEISSELTLQLTCVSKKWCKITSIATDKNGVSSVAKEEKLNWDF